MIKILPFVFLITFVSLFSSSRATGDDLGSVLREAGWDSVIGIWVDPETNGEKRELKFEWLYEDTVIQITNREGELKTTALMARHPNTGEVSHVAADSEGGSSIGKWTVVDDEAVLEMLFVSGSGKEGGLQVRHRMTGANDMTVTVVLPEPMISSLERVVNAEQAETSVKTQTVKGVLKHHPQDVKSVQAWQGHEFMVGETPVRPTKEVSAETLVKFVGQSVWIEGAWNPGKVWKPNAEEQQLSQPLLPGKGVVTRGEGIEASKIRALKK